MPIEAPRGEDEAPRLSAAGARIEVPRGMWYGEGVSPSPRNLLILTRYGGFWCILGVFFTIQLPVLHAKPEFNRYRRIKAVMVSR